MTFFRFMQERKTENLMTKRDYFSNRRSWPGICLGLVLMSFAPGIVALGLGELHVTSKLGEHFSGRIPIYATPGESVEPSCFKLLTESPRQDGIPLIDSARLTVNGGSGVPYLRVSGQKRINDLAVRLAIRVGCESEITREYTTLLDLADNVSDQAVVNAALIAAPKPVSPAGPRDHRSGGLEWEVRAGESLTGIAANIYPDSRRMQRRFVRHAIESNPEVFADKNPDAILPAGTVLHFPGLRELAREPVAKKSGRRLAAEPIAQPDTKPDTKPDKPPVSPKTAKAKKTDAEADVRLKLTTGDLDISASGKITEGERELLREKQRILMDIDDMAARNLSLNHRLKQMEEHIQGLQAKLEGLDRQRSEMASGHPVSPAPAVAPKPSQAEQEWPAYAGIVAFLVAAAGLLMAVYLKRKRKWAKAEALMGLDVDLGRAWEAGPEAKKPGLADFPSESVNAGEPMERAVEPVRAPEIDREPSSSEAPKEPRGVFDPDLEIITLGGIESAIEETDIYLALGEKDRAIANLKYHIDSQPRATVDLWLKLLEIYHNFDMRPEFETLATEFRQYFNIVKPNWETMEPGENHSRGIEQFPHLIEKITSTWGSPACLEYLHHLLLDNRGGLRDGFELGMASDILLLIHLLEAALGKSAVPPAALLVPPVLPAAPPAVETASEEIGALEFTFEPRAPVEPEKFDLALPELELDMLPAVEPVSGPALLSMQPAPAPPSKPEFSPVADPRSALEIRYLRIAEKITLIWGEPEVLHHYLESLLVDDRGGRAGFAEDIISELMMLSSVAGANEGATDIWGLSGKNKPAA